MAIDLLKIQPHKVSRDLTGYITYLYGAAKTGKTTLATRSPGALLLAFERGYNTLPGVMAQDITSWGDVKSIVRELKKPEVQEVFHTVIFDTIDIAGTLCEKYICSQNGVDKLSDIPWGGGWGLIKREFETVVRGITQLGYAVFFISHDKDREFTRKDGTKYNQIVPSCASSFNDIAKNAADIYAYSEKYEEGGIGKVKLVLRSVDNSIDTGCRFKYIVPECDMSYEALVKSINDAIDKEANLTGNKFVTDERNVEAVAVPLDYDALMAEFQSMASSLMQKDGEYYGPRITHIVEKYLGKGNKISDATLGQVEQINLVVEEIRDELFNK